MPVTSKDLENRITLEFFTPLARTKGMTSEELQLLKLLDFIP